MFTISEAEMYLKLKNLCVNELRSEQMCKDGVIEHAKNLIDNHYGDESLLKKAYNLEMPFCDLFEKYFQDNYQLDILELISLLSNNLNEHNDDYFDLVN